ncbi:hypothetical protein MAR_018751 [Mya arenaria]|uniref:Uncharacterized protein n=1 Tax=Mya arenaria TaxID=6604 RepID=A0ABY7EFK5_MYAAR|nr:hypothetical protein MAR_018751 [Mya arenaria]
MCEGKGVGQYTFSNRDAARVVLMTGFEAGSVIDVPGDELSIHASTTHTTRPPRMDNDVEEIPISDDITALPVSILTYATTTYSTPPLTTYHEEISISARYPILSIILPIMTALLFVLLAFVCVCMCRGRCQRRNGGSIELREACEVLQLGCFNDNMYSPMYSLKTSLDSDAIPLCHSLAVVAGTSEKKP